MTPSQVERFGRDFGTCESDSQATAVHLPCRHAHWTAQLLDGGSDRDSSLSNRGPEKDLEVAGYDSGDYKPSKRDAETGFFFTSILLVCGYKRVVFVKIRSVFSSQPLRVFKL